MRVSDHISPILAAPERFAHLMKEGWVGSSLVPRLQFDLALAFWRGARRQARAVLKRCEDEQQRSRRNLARLAEPHASAKPKHEVAAPRPAPSVPPGSDAMETILLPTGESMDLRAMLPSDGPALTEMLKMTTPEDRRLRFLSSGIAISDALIGQLTGFDRSKGLALCAFRPGTQEMIAVARLHSDASSLGPSGRQGAEFAILVRSDWHGHGIGHALMERLIAAGRKRGFAEIWGHVLAENLAMVRMCHHLGFRRDPDRSTAGLHVMARPLGPDPDAAPLARPEAG